MNLYKIKINYDQTGISEDFIDFVAKMREYYFSSSLFWAIITFDLV